AGADAVGLSGAAIGYARIGSTVQRGNPSFRVEVRRELFGGHESLICRTVAHVANGNLRRPRGHRALEMLSIRDGELNRGRREFQILRGSRGRLRLLTLFQVNIAFAARALNQVLADKINQQFVGASSGSFISRTLGNNMSGEGGGLEQIVIWSENNF